jgi:hypothetical protein
VLSPTTTNEFLFTFSKLKLDIRHTNPDAVSLSALGFPNFAGPWGQQTDVAPVNLINTRASLSAPVGPARRLFATTPRDVHRHLHRVLNTRHQGRHHVERARKDQNPQNDENVEMIRLELGQRDRQRPADTITARPDTSGTASIIGNFQLWNIDFFVQTPGR